MELNFVGKAQGKCESHREPEGGRELGTGIQGWVRETEGKDRARGTAGG